MVWNPTISAVAVLAFLFCMSLVGAYATLRLMRGAAKIQRKGVQLGGAAAMFVVTFVLLNYYLPDLRLGFVEEAKAAAQPVEARSPTGAVERIEVQLSPATQLLTTADSNRLDKNQYTLFADQGVAMPTPRTPNLVLEKRTDIPLIGVNDVPYMRQSYQTMQTLFNMHAPSVVSIHTRNVTEIEVTPDSILGGIPVTFNPFTDKQLMKASVQAALGMMRETGLLPPGEIPDNAMNEAGTAMAKAFDDKISRSLPFKRSVQSGLFVLPLTPDLLNLNLISKFSSVSLLDKAMLFLSASGNLGAGSAVNLYTNQQRGLASFNSSVNIQKVLIAGRTTDARVNQVGFVVAGVDRAYLVMLVYLSSDDVEVFRQLEDALQNLRLVA